MKRNRSILPALVMIFSILISAVSANIAYAGRKEVDVDITKFEIQHTSHIEADKLYFSDTFLLMMNWDASKNGTNLHEGDYFDVKLPDEMRFPSDTTERDFEIKNDEGKVIANAHVTPGANDVGGKIRVTFTNAVENKYGVKGTIYLAAKFNKEKLIMNQSNTFTITVGSKIITDNVLIVGPKKLENEHINKWGGKVEGKPKEVAWHVRINHTGDELSDVVIKDDFSKSGQKLVDKSFVLKKVKFNEYGDISQTIEDINVESKLQISSDKNSFTLTLGNLGKEDRYYLGYRTTYTPGTTLKNELNFVSLQAQKHIVASHHSAQSGGTGDGSLASKIKLIKVDEENEEIKLANAVFEVTKPNGDKFELTTGADGEVISGILEQGEYKVKEKSAPIGYELNDEEYTLKVTPTGGAIKTITNKPLKTEVSVKKEWIGKELGSVTVKLYADDKDTGKSIELNKENNWKYTFANLKKYNSDGEEIKYSVKEDEPKGYKVKYSGNMEEGFVITNTKENTDITAVKKWEGGPSEKPTVWFKLYRKVEGETEAKPVEKIAEEALFDGKTSVTWKNLPKTDDNGKEYIYSVKEGELKDGEFTEKAPDNYVKTENGLTVTNKYYSPKIEITGKKVWENEEGKPTVKLQLYKNEKAEGNPVELKDGKTEHTWKNLDKTDDNGKEYVYTVKEVGEENGSIQMGNAWYKVTYEGDAQKGFVVKNKKLPPVTPMIPPTRDIKVTKEWKDHNGKTITAPTDKITVELYKDGVATGDIKELTKDNNWTVTFEKLKVYESIENPAIHKYTVKEVGENKNSIKIGNAWYKVTYEGDAQKGFTIKNKKLPPLTPMEPPTREVKVIKEWKDSYGNNLNEAPVDKIKVELYKDGEATGKTLELNESNNWTAAFKKLPVSETLGGTNHEYTVKEVGEEGNVIKFDGKKYKVVYGGSMKEGLTVTNEKEEPPTPPSVEKPKIPPTPKSKLPKTGYGSNISIYTMMTILSTVVLIALGNKKKKKRELICYS